MPTGPPGNALSPGVKPILHLPGVMIPGQFGPSMRVPAKSRLSWLYRRASSWAGIPSVTQTTNGMPDSAASITAAAAPGAGTMTNDALAPVAPTASATVSNTGMPSTSVPPLPSRTPATTCVP